MSIQESNYALLVADKLLHKALTQIKGFQADGWVVVDQTHEIAQLVSQALQQHGRNALDILLLLLSAAAEVWETMNNGQVPQWECVCAGDSCMESHLFFPKTKGFVAPGVAQASQPINAITPWLPKVMEEDPEDKSTTTTKKCKLAKCISKAILTDTEDEDGPLAGPTIFVKPPKGVVPITPAPSNSKASTSVKSLPMYLLTASQDVTKEVKKDKGKVKVVAVKEPELYDPPCAKCFDKHKCVITYGVRGLPVEACGRCFTLKVKCEWPVADTAPTDHVRVPHPQSKATLVLKSKPASRTTRATSCIHPPMPVVKSKDTMDDADVAVAAHEANAEWPTHIAAMTPTEPEVDHPAAIASADDFPTDHWQEDSDAVIMPPPSPPYFPSPPPHSTKPTILDAESTVRDLVVTLVAHVAAMEVAD
ncbi:hypothetical protein BDR04DRAFT_1152087 [Suillus decipiens]|nr:hypothetical protein BDR04DRAFT_1152087 [Suillus decipiens]